MNILYNNLHGKIPNLALKFTNNPEIDLSWNQFEGSVPLFLLQASALHLSNNKFRHIVCGKGSGLGLLDVYQLQGKLPNCWNNLNSLRFLDLSNNKMSGKIPFSMGALANIEGSILRINSLNGQLPSSLKNYSKLALLDIGENQFYGPIPLWIGESLQQFQILSLTLNYFHGSIPSNLCFLRKLQVLDLSLNNLSPACIKNFTAMAQDTTSSTPSMDSGNWHITCKDTDGFFKAYYDLNLFLMRKGVDRGFKNADMSLKSIDFSSNHLTGEMPAEIEHLHGLVSLNLSRNSLSGEIISNIGNLKSLEFLDLSRNHFSGIIPSSLAQIDRLTMLDLSNNNLHGKIPFGTQLQSFNASSFDGNFNLCGAPLDICPEASTDYQKQSVPGRDDNSVFLEALYMSMGLGYFIGFGGFIGSILVPPYCRETCSSFLKALVNRILTSKY